MRFVRTLLVALLATALLGLAPVGPVVAGAVSAPTGDPAPRASSTTVKKLTGKIVKRKGKLFLTGVIRPKKGPVQVQRATSCNKKKGTCNFKKYRKAKVDKSGRYTVRVYAPTTGSWAWRARKNATVSPAWVTCVKKPDEDCATP